MKEQLRKLAERFARVVTPATEAMKSITEAISRSLDSRAKPLWRRIDLFEKKVTRCTDPSVSIETQQEKDLAALRGKLRFPAIMVTVLTMALAWVILGQFGTMLEGMHVPADSPVSVETLAKTGDAAGVKATWNAWERVSGDSYLAPGVVFAWFVVIDFGFILTYTVVLAFILIRLRRRIAPCWARSVESLADAFTSIKGSIEAANTGRDQEHAVPKEPDAEELNDIAAQATAWSKPLCRLALLLGLLVLFDLIEGVLLLVAYFVTDSVAWVLPVAYWGKWFVAFVLAASLIFFARAAPAPRRTLEGVGDPLLRGWRGLLALRVPIILLGVLTLFFFGVMDQFPDVPRRWSVVQAAATLGLGLALAGAIWAFSFSVARRTDGLCRPEASRLLRDIVAWVTVGLGILSVVAAIVWPVGLGLLIPAGMVVAFAIAGSRLPDPEQREKCPGDEAIVPRRSIPSSTPRFLGAAVVAVLGLAVVISATPDLGFQRAGVAQSRWWLSLLLLIPFVIHYLSTDKGRDMVDSASNRFGTTSTALLGWGWFFGLAVAPLALPIFLFGNDGPQLSTPILFGLGVVITYLAYGVYYYFDEAYSPLLETGKMGKTLPTLQHLLFEWSEQDGAKRRFVGWSDNAERIFWGTGAVYLAVVAVLAWWPLPVAAWIGSTAIVLLFLLLVAVLAELAALFAENTDAPEVLRHLGMQRTPMFTLLAVWILVASQFPFFRVDDYHDVRILEVQGTSAARSGVALEGPNGGFARWTTNNAIDAQGPGERRAAVPLVIVSAWGGGIRAAVWTSLVLDCMFEDGHSETYCNQGAVSLSDRLFAISGISGGALGAIEYTTYLESKRLGLEVGTNGSGSWVPEVMGDDYLSPTLSQLLFVDAPLSLMGHISSVDDRATVSERAWEASWPKAPGEDETVLATGLFELWDRNTHVPIVVANGASRTDKCGLNGSVLDESVESTVDGLVFDDCESLEPYTATEPIDDEVVGPAEASLVGNRDLVDFLCADQDVRLSSTAMLSARFNYVSPSGRLSLEKGECGPDDPRAEQSLYMIDGGNLELSGTLTAFQLWDAIEPLIARHNATADYCIVPFMIHLENGFSPPRVEGLDAGLPNEWLVGTGNLRDGLVGNARARAALEFSKPLLLPDGTELDIEIGDGGIDPTTRRYAFVTTQAHPGVSAPLGWSLSERAMDDLQTQLEVNDTQLSLIQQWLTGSMTCDPLGG